jgi:hypothetical protein
MADPPFPRQWWKPPWQFLVETIVGILIFGVIAAAALAIKLIVRWLSSRGIDSYIIFGLTAAEYALFTTDLVLFGRFLWKTALRIWKDL